MRGSASSDTSKEAGEALLLWLAFMLASILVNATIPFMLGADVRAWTDSAAKYILSGLVIYGGLFLVAPLVLVKGWQIVRQPTFLVLLGLAVFAAGLWNVFRGVGVVIVVVLALLHWRYDLSELGIRSSGWRGDAVAVLLVAALYSIPRLFRPISGAPDFLGGLQTGFFRLANPATSAEYLFYFGFLAMRLSRRVGTLLTPILIGLMYMTHEMTNPEYWYEGMQFALVFIGVAIASVLYLWRKSLIPIWLGDGLARFFQGLY